MSLTLLNHRYRILHALGTGGFGNTFLAEDTQMPSLRRCVIKQLKPLIHNPQLYSSVQARFQREAAILETLGEGHNQIPKLYAYFSADSLFYLVQEWIDGQTLNQKVHTDGPLSDRQVIDFLLNLLPVLDYVHRQELIHRDIKPSNILLRSSDNKPVLIDFGAVKASMSGLDTESGNTRSMAIGTPAFMPPEQAVGKPVYASDLYSLGWTGLFLLTGKSPLDVSCDPESGLPLWPDEAININPLLKSVIEKALALHPRDRFPNAKAMLSALQNEVSLLPTLPTEPSPSITQAPPSHYLAPIDPPSQLEDTPNTLLQTASTQIQPPFVPWRTPLQIMGLVSLAVGVGLILPELPQRPSTPAPSPSPAPTVTGQRVSIGLNATGALINGNAVPTEPTRYLLNCRQAQQMWIEIRQGDVAATLFTPSGQLVGKTQGQPPRWHGFLPVTGDYVLEISTPKGTYYEFIVKVL